MNTRVWRNCAASAVFANWFCAHVRTAAFCTLANVVGAHASLQFRKST